MDILEENKKAIDQRLEAGLALLREQYTVEECAVDEELAHPIIAGSPYLARRFDIRGVGNLLLMSSSQPGPVQMSSFGIMPYSKNLPLISTDFMYMGDKRFYLMEIYDLSVRNDGPFEAGIAAFKAFADTVTDLPTVPTKPGWYDAIRPVCIAKGGSPAQDAAALDHFLAFLKVFIGMEQAAPVLEGADLAEKWQKNKAYADRLIDEGGVSTDMFIASLGAEKTRRFFHEVFFGAACYEPEA